MTMELSYAKNCAKEWSDLLIEQGRAVEHSRESTGFSVEGQTRAVTVSLEADVRHPSGSFTAVLEVNSHAASSVRTLHAKITGDVTSVKDAVFGLIDGEVGTLSAHDVAINRILREHKVKWTELGGRRYVEIKSGDKDQPWTNDLLGHGVELVYRNTNSTWTQMKSDGVHQTLAPQGKPY
jgi:hypothetical protein